MTFVSSITPISFDISHLSPTNSSRQKQFRPRPPPLRLGIIEEEASSSEYEFGSLNLGAESPRSNHSTTSLLDNSAYVRQWAEAGIAVPRVPARKSLRSSSFSRDCHRPSSMRDDDRDCGICFEYAVRPCRTLCCGKIFCTEHLADWLHGPNAEGRCPNCENACSLDGGTLSLSSPPLLATAQSPSRRHTLTPSNRSPYHPSPLTVAQFRSNDTLRDQPLPLSEVVLRIPDDTSSSTSTTLVSGPAFSSTPDEDADEYHHPHNMKGSFTQLGSASASAINLSTTPFSSSWGAISRLMSIITFLMFIYKLLS